MTLRTLSLLLLALFAFSGCVQSDTRSETQTVTHTTHTIQGDVVVPVTTADGAVHPVPLAVNLTVTSDSSRDTNGQSQTKTGIDPATLNALVGMLVPAMKTAFPGLAAVGSVLTAGAQAAQGWSNTTVGSLAGATGTALLAAGGAYLRSRDQARQAAEAATNAAAHKKDADEAWNIVGKVAKGSADAAPK